MAVKSIEIVNVMIFQRQWRINNTEHADSMVKEGDTISGGFQLNFCDGINVLIGENGVGKTTILKMIYAAAKQSLSASDKKGNAPLSQYFSNGLSNSNALRNISGYQDISYYKVSDGVHSFEEILSLKELFHDNGWKGLNISSVFIPTTEMLSHAKGFLALNEKYRMPFDETQIDIIVNASLPETREISPLMRDILKKISDAIDGEVIVEKDSFFVEKKDGRKVEFSLEAEGLRKLGLLWKLIRNGLLERGSILLWDEPEANLNPELYPLVTEILLELQKNGVQIFLATHSYNFAKYLEIRRTKKEQVMFHNLYQEQYDISDSLKDILPQIEGKPQIICSQSAYRMDEINYNHIMIADNKLLDEVYDL